MYIPYVPAVASRGVLLAPASPSAGRVGPQPVAGLVKSRGPSPSQFPSASFDSSPKLLLVLFTSLGKRAAACSSPAAAFSAIRA